MEVTLAPIRLTNAAALAPTRLTNAAPQLPYGSGETKGELPYGSGETKGEGMPLHFTHQDKTDRPLQSSTNNLDNIFCSFSRQKLLNPLHNLDSSVRIDKIDRAYLDR
jgi:hypothetical protein